VNCSSSIERISYFIWQSRSPSIHAIAPLAPCLQSKWYQWGFVFSVLYLAVWVFVGGAWWKALGIY
jgi:hypothetical protein